MQLCTHAHIYANTYTNIQDYMHIYIYIYIYVPLEDNKIMQAYKITSL